MIQTAKNCQPMEEIFTDSFYTNFYVRQIVHAKQSSKFSAARNDSARCEETES